MSGSGTTSTAASKVGAEGAGKESFWDKVKHFFTGESDENVKYRDTVSGMNWDENRSDNYYRGINEGGALVSVSGSRIEQARSILVDAGGDLRESGFEAIPKTTNAEIRVEEPDQTIQLRGEILRTFKERIQTRRGPPKERCSYGEPDSRSAGNTGRISDRACACVGAGERNRRNRHRPGNPSASFRRTCTRGKTTCR
jgi:hypothetical protein